ncbi:MAG: sensor histidine kinase [bacterium]
MQDKGFSIARNLANRSVDLILIDDVVSLQRLVNDTVELEKDVIYVFIVNTGGRPVVHTFSGVFPAGLIEATFPNREKNIHLLHTEKGLIQDLALPILEGSLGSLHIGMSPARFRRAISATIFRLIVIIGVILTIGIGCIYLLIKRILAPLVEISKAIKEIGRGNFKQELRIKTTDEVGLLAQTFNEMARDLERTNQELQSTQSQLIQTAKMATVGRLAAGIAHEINNPLGGMLNCVRSVLQAPEIKGQKREYLELILESIIHIEGIVKRLLNFSRHEKFKLKTVNLNPLIKESLTFIEHRLSRQEVNVQQDLADPLPEISVDPQQIQQVFMNVLGNALDALPQGGELMIRTSLKAKNEKEFIQIEFIDNGMGIKEEDLEKVFEPFYTTKGTGERVGLGLSISRDIIQRHQGTMSIKSKKGEGTIVTIRLPLSQKIDYSTILNPVYKVL